MNRSTRGEPRAGGVRLRTAGTVCSLLTWFTPLLLAATITSAAADVPDVPCVGDCNNDQEVTVSEAVTLISIALGDAQLAACPNGLPISGVNVAVIIQAVIHAVNGCPVLGAGDCCQCADFCAAPVDGTCGGCALFFGAPCTGGSLCVKPTPTPTAPPVNTPTPTNTPGARDCCQCPTSCAVPIAGSCGGCPVVLDAACGGGMLCVPHAATPGPTPTPPTGAGRI